MAIDSGRVELIVKATAEDKVSGEIANILINKGSAKLIK